MKFLGRILRKLMGLGKAKKAVIIASAALFVALLIGVGSYVIALLPNFAHGTCANCHTTVPGRDHSNCAGCHGGAVPYDPNLVAQPKNIIAEFSKPYHHPISSTDPNSTCKSCHNNMGDLDPTSNYYPKLLRAQDAIGNYVYQGNAYCYVCHGAGSTYNMVDFDSSAHNDSRLDPASGTKARCSSCHLAHGGDFAGFTRAKDENLCYQCHNNPANSEHGINVQGQFTASTNGLAQHNLGTNLQCRNCHEAHSNTRTNKMADPDSPTKPKGLYTATALDPKNYSATRYEESNVAVAYTGAWQTKYDSRDSGGSSKRPWAAGSSATLTFVGSGINVIMRNGWSVVTFYNIYIDGVQQPVPAISSRGYQQVVFSRSDLLYGVHSIRVVHNGTTSIYMPYLDAFDVLNSATLISNYGGFCDKCHDNSPPSGITISGLKNIASTYLYDFHGDAPGPELLQYTQGRLAPPYTREMVALSCSDCHDEHGSSNVYHLKETVNGKTGISVKDVGGSDAYNFCTACHTGTLDDFHDCGFCHGSPTYGVNTCFSCHFHGASKDSMPYGNGTSGDF